MVASADAAMSLTAHEPILVPPIEPTPSHVLSLSNLDDQLFLRFTIKYIFLYERKADDDHALDFVQTTREALSRVLVFYYPLAGRLRRSDDKIEVVCNGEGAVFVEAACTDFTVEDFRHFQKPSKSWKKLLYKVAADSFVGIPPLIVQVTRLGSGGFALCVGICHCLCDGLGSSQFLHAWGEISRGANGISVTPFWERHLLQSRFPPLVQFSHPEFAQVQDFSNLKDLLRPEELACSSVCFHSDQLLQLKKVVCCDAGDPAPNSAKCTSFEALAAHVWRCWIRALDLPVTQAIKLLFSVNVRKRLEPQLPEGFYGNGFLLGCAETTVKELTESSLLYAVKLVQKAKATLTNEYVRSVIDRLEDKTVRPDLVASLVISQWSRLELTTVDLGLGQPVHVGPLASDIYCLFLPVHGEPDAVNVLLSVPQSILHKYEYYMQNIDSSSANGVGILQCDLY